MQFLVVGIFLVNSILFSISSWESVAVKGPWHAWMEAIAYAGLEQWCLEAIPLMYPGRT